MFKYRGAIHIHTVKSDGSGDLRTVADAARKAGLSWIIVTDHNYIDKEEGFINGIYVIKGQEVSPEAENHYIVIGVDKIISPNNDLQTNIDTVREAGGYGFAAHPDESDNRKNNNKPIKWLDKNIIPDGIELWNMFSQWGDGYDSRNIFTAMYSYFFRNRLITEPYRETIDWWDKLNNDSQKIVPAIGGVDAHALIRKDYIIPLKIFPYEYCFKTITNEIILSEKLSDNFEKAKLQIINALKSGNNNILNNIVCKKSPEIFIENRNSRAYSGMEIELDDNTFLKVHSDKKLKILVFKNGLQYNCLEGKTLELKLSEIGKYRAAALYNGKSFMYTNPILVQ